MKRLHIFLALLLMVSVNVAYAAKPTQEEKDAKKADRDAKKVEMAADKEAERDARKAERDAKIADKKAAIAEKKLTKICERVEKSVDRLQKRSQDREERTLQKLEQRRTQIQEKRTMQNKELAERRQSRDVQREEFYAQMRDMAESEEQLAAVDAFEEVIEPAITARRTAIDAATEEMRMGIDSLVDEHIANLQTLYAEYQDAESAALAEAESYCGENSTESDIKGFEKRLRTELRAAGKMFKQNAKDQRNINKAVQELARVRRDSVKMAVDEFKAVMQDARIQLAEVFGLEDIVDTDNEDNEDEDEMSETSEVDQNQESSEEDPQKSSEIVEE